MQFVLPPGKRELELLHEKQSTVFSVPLFCHSLPPSVTKVQNIYHVKFGRIREDSSPPTSCGKNWDLG